VTFTEKELLAAALKQAEGVDPSSVALSFEPGVAKLWLDIGEILKQNKENNELNFPLDLSIFEGVILSADLVSIDNGTGLSVENLTTGNPLVDSLIPSDLINQYQENFSLEKLVSESEDPDFTITKVEFMEDK